MKCYDSKERLTVYGLYLEVKKEVEVQLKKHPDLNKRTVTYREFRAILYSYLECVLFNLLKGYGFDLHNNLGELRIIKTKLTRYKPSYYKPNKVNEAFTKNYWHHLFWFAPKKYRMYQIRMNSRWRSEMMRVVNKGHEFIEYTEQKSGYIYKVK